jgi:hypothetical protein
MLVIARPARDNQHLPRDWCALSNICPVWQGGASCLIARNAGATQATTTVPAPGAMRALRQARPLTGLAAQ